MSGADAAFGQFVLTAVLVVGTGIGIVYKLANKVDELKVTHTEHTKLCAERHRVIDARFREVNGRVQRVEDAVFKEVH
jgi:hypothetical protein